MLALLIRNYFLVLALSLSCLLPRPSSAEWFVEAYGGYSWTHSMDVAIEGSADVAGIRIPVRAELFDVEAEDSLLAGLRVGYWFARWPDVGIALDAFYFEPDIRSQRVDAVANVDIRVPEIFDQPIEFSFGAPVSIQREEIPAVAFVSPELRARWRLLPNTQAPQGQLQPYFVAGPAFLLTDADDFSTALGVKLGGGVLWQFHRHFGLFGEYRYTHFSPKVESGDFEYETDLTTHHVLGGISARF